MQDILLIGGGGHCKAVIDVIELEGRFKIAGIIDQKKLLGSKVLGYEVIGNDDDLKSLSKHYKYAFITVGQIYSNELRVKIYQHLKTLNFTLPTIISPLAYLSKHAQLGEGTILMHHSIVNANSIIGINCIVNSKALVEHDCKVENHVHISTNATINGGCVVKEHTFVGSGATTKESVTLSGFIKAGSVVK